MAIHITTSHGLVLAAYLGWHQHYVIAECLKYFRAVNLSPLSLSRVPFLRLLFARPLCRLILNAISPAPRAAWSSFGEKLAGGTVWTGSAGAGHDFMQRALSDSCSRKQLCPLRLKRSTQSGLWVGITESAEGRPQKSDLRRGMNEMCNIIILVFISGNKFIPFFGGFRFDWMAEMGNLAGLTVSLLVQDVAAVMHCHSGKRSQKL